MRTKSLLRPLNDPDLDDLDRQMLDNQTVTTQEFT
jgi:hypothetical protein